MGEPALLEALGISRHLMYRALAGLRLRRASVAFIETELAKFERRNGVAS